MKKLFIVLTMLFLMCPMFAKTVQCVKSYKLFDSHYSSVLDMVADIQQILDKGWKVASITQPIKNETNSDIYDCGI